MASRTRQGFTLVELLVVITIIGMLMALLFPAIGAVVGMARQMDCQNRLGELAKAMGTLESTKGQLPGYLHRLPVRQGGSGSVQMQNVSWVVAALEVTSPADYTAIKNGNAAVNRHFAKMNCPSDPPAQNDESISYVANCGMLDQGGGRTFPDRIGNGVFHREGSTSQGGKFVKMTYDKIKGLDRTIMFSENRQAGYWTSVNEADIGMLWWLDQTSPNFPEPESKRINKQADVIVQGDPNYARPSSNHAGGVMIAFCNTGTRFLSQDITYVVYCQLMISDASRAGNQGQKGRLPSPQGDPLDMTMLDP